jgi:Divergent InlB B-repeat domain
VRRLTILLAALGALLLVPAAQAFANGEMHVTIVGTGEGLVSSVGGQEENGFFEGEPPIECHKPSQGGDVCDTELAEFIFAPGKEAIALHAVPAEGSEFVGWTVEEGAAETDGCAGEGIEQVQKECTAAAETEGADVKVTAEFASEGPLNPTPLTLNIEEGEGTVVSNPAGIECVGAAPTSCESEFEENEAVTLTASPAPGFLFKGWKKCDKGGAVGRQCTVTMSEAKEVGAKFIASFDVTLQNGGGGKVYSKPGGALCMPNCTEVTASFKEGKPVEVLNKPNKHFHLVEFGGDCSGTSCSGLEANSTVSASFAEDPTQTLTLAKEGGGQGLVKSKPAGLNCTYTCSSQEVAFYEEAIEISWKLGKGTSSLEWATGAGTCTGSSEAETGSCSVTMSAAKSLVAKFE